MRPSPNRNGRTGFDLQKADTAEKVLGRARSLVLHQ
jgi:hypothetical protein